MQNLRTISNNIKFIYGYSFFQTFLVCIPIIVPYWKGLGLSIQQIFFLQGLFGMALIIFDAPAGYIADLIGRRKTMLLGSVISALGFQILWLGQTYEHFIWYEIVLGLGLSLQSGCDVAMLYSTAEATNHKSSSGKFLSRRLSIQTFSEGIASLVAAGLTVFSIRWPILLNAATPWAMVLFAYLTVEPPTKKLDRHSHLANFKLIGKALFGHSKLLTRVIISFIFYSFATYAAVWCLQPYWESVGIKTHYFGILWGINSFITAIVSFYAKSIEKKLGPTKVILIIAAAPIVGYFGMGFTGGLLGLVFAIFFPICRGLNGVLFQDALNSRIPSEVRSTANSLGSLGMRAVFLIFGPILGWTIDNQGPPQALQLMGYVFCGLFFVIIMPLLRVRKDFRINE